MATAGRIALEGLAVAAFGLGGAAWDQFVSGSRWSGEQTKSWADVRNPRWVQRLSLVVAITLAVGGLAVALTFGLVAALRAL